MPKKKIEAVKEKPVPLVKPFDDVEEEKIIDPEGILGDENADEEEELTMDEDEVDPFGDKYEQ
jgi:hypothetical protein